MVHDCIFKSAGTELTDTTTFLSYATTAKDTVGTAGNNNRWQLVRQAGISIKHQTSNIKMSARLDLRGEGKEERGKSKQFSP